MGEGVVVTFDSPVSREELFFLLGQGTNVAYIALKRVGTS